MKQKIFTLMALLCLVVTQGWADFSATPLQTLESDYDVAAGTSVEITSTYATISGGGSFTAINADTESKKFISKQTNFYAFALLGGKTGFKIELTEALADGDVISVNVLTNGSGSSNDRGIWITTDTSRPSSAPTCVLLGHSETAKEYANATYEVEEDDGICGKKTIYIWRATGNSTYFKDLTITGSSGGATTTYTVTYNGNGNTGGSVPTDSDSPYEEGDEVTVLSNTGSLTKTSYEWTGWNTSTDGSGTDYSAGGTFTMGTSNVVLYAKWNQVAPVITTQPVSASYYTDGTPVDLTVAATAASGDLTYQWYTNTTGTADPSSDDAVEGATTATLAAANLAFVADETHYYYCVVNDDSNNPVTSDVARIAVFTKLSGYPDANYLELDGNTSAGDISFTQSSKYTIQDNACTFYGKSYTKGLKQESATTTTFTTTEYSTITIAQPLTNNAATTIAMNVDGGDYTELSAWANCTVTTYSDNSNLNYQKVKVYKITNCKAGTYIIKQGSGQSYVAYIGITYTPKTDTDVETGEHDPYYATTDNATGISGGGVNEVTFDGVATMTGENLQSGTVMLSIDGGSYKSMKADKKTYTLTPADGVTITGVKLYGTSISEDAMSVTTQSGTTELAALGETPTEVTLGTDANDKYYFTVSGDTYQALVVLKITYTTAKSVDVSVSSAGYATLFYGTDVTIPEGVEAYYGKQNGTSFSMTKIEDGKIPANTGVILKAAQGTYTFTETTGATAIADNDLTGTTTGTTVEENSVYTLGQNSEGVVGLRLYTGTSIRAYSAYMPVQGGANFYSLTFDEEEQETTRIEEWKSSVAEEWKSAPMYNLSGQRVGSDYKGIVIVNGKKMINK